MGVEASACTSIPSEGRPIPMYASRCRGSKTATPPAAVLIVLWFVMVSPPLMEGLGCRGWRDIEYSIGDDSFGNSPLGIDVEVEVPIVDDIFVNVASVRDCSCFVYVKENCCVYFHFFVS